MAMRKKVKQSTQRGYSRLNKHIDFEREGAKGNARKWATEVTCVRCKKQVVLPFKPRNPEVYCDECFKKKNSKKAKEHKQF